MPTVEKLVTVPKWLQDAFREANGHLPAGVGIVIFAFVTRGKGGVEVIIAGDDGVPRTAMVAVARTLVDDEDNTRREAALLALNTGIPHGEDLDHLILGPKAAQTLRDFLQEEATDGQG